jgi:tetrapyrrole methylase family protein/MazG family protein
MTTAADHRRVPRIVIVGLGPGGHDHVTVEVLAEIDRIPHRYLRTRVHPSAVLVGEATSFDDLYESAATFDDVYTEIADQLAAAAAHHGEILYAVPGSPLVLERTVATASTRSARVEIGFVPGVTDLMAGKLVLMTRAASTGDTSSTFSALDTI